MSKWMEKFVENFKKDKKRSLLILILTGVLILVIAWPVSDGGSGGSSGESNAGFGQGSTSPNSAGSENGGSGTVSALNGGSPGSDQTLEEYVALLEERLTDILSNVSGAGKVQVMITARATREKVVEKDVTQSSARVSESDSNGGTRVTDESSYSETSLYTGSTSGQGSGEPYVVKELVPEIEGVVVAAQGAGDEYVIDEITQAVSVLFDLPVHKIKVVKMES